MEFKNVYNFLDTGWICIKFNDDYFNSSFISHIPKKYVKKIDQTFFVKKSKKVYDILSIMGMDMSRYDSIVSINLCKEKSRIEIDYEAIDSPEGLIDVSNKILNMQNK